jgi:hypothetical protein
MKGSLWSLLVVAVFLALLLPAVGVGYSDVEADAVAANESVSDSTQDVVLVFDVVEPFLGLMFLVFALGTLWVMTSWGGGF